MARFPAVESLATAPVDEVLHHWSGLGYYARARNLHRAAQLVCDRVWRRISAATWPAMQSLPGIGRSTAAAILSLAGGQRQTILDGNVKRVLARYFAEPGWPGRTAVLNRLWELAESLTPEQRVAAYNQAMMDLGAGVCTRGSPDCADCPLNRDCAAFGQGRPTGLSRQKAEKVSAAARRYACCWCGTPRETVLLEQTSAGRCLGRALVPARA